jgi:hypothetical protein
MLAASLSQSSFPKNGLLSGMILPALAAATALLIGFFLPNVAQIFSGTPSIAFLNSFLVSICLMTVHKIESYLTHEYDVCPVYLTNGQASWAQNPRQAIFVAFVSTFIGMSFMMFLIFKGPPWPLLLLSIWMAQGLHEFHHSAKSLAQKSYYSGTISALLFTAQIDIFVFPKWYGDLGLASTAGFYAYYLIQPVVFLGFYLEHRGWLVRKCH